jgi:hypothetical protein
MKIVKGILKIIGAILAILVVVGTLQMAWGVYREPIAKTEAMDFCSTVRIGQAIEGIQERAIDSGAEKAFAKWTAQGSGSRTMAVIFVGMPPFSRHICLIEAATTVVRAEYIYVD